MSQSTPCKSCNLATTRGSGYCKRCDTMRTQLERIADNLTTAAEAVRKHGPMAWVLTADWQTPLRSVESCESTGKGNVSRPTENAAMAIDPLTAEHAMLKHELSILDDNAKSVVRRIVNTVTQDRSPGRVNTAAMCSNIHGCPDDNYNERDRGRCKPCANYLRTHNRDRTRGAA